MAIAVHFGRKLELEAIEIEDIEANAVLTTKSVLQDLSVAQSEPGAAFGLGEIVTKI